MPRESPTLVSTVAGHPPRPAHYRPDIDGLRAVAVALVVAFHAFPEMLPGGFIGVDVFFVISGYLISGIIFSSLHAGTFSYADFYASRIRRIFPALALVLGLSAAYGWLVLLPDEYRQLGKHIAAGAGFVSNITFWLEAGYFDTAAALKPLQHIWSLGVEEQFYLFWPLLMALSWKRRGCTGAIIAATLITSLLFNLHAVARHPVSTFFLPFTRIWELMFGAILAYGSYVAAHGATTRLDRKLGWLARLSETPALANAAAAAGALSVIAALWLIGPESSFPGWWALVPVAGTCLIIAAGNLAWLNRRILASRTLVQLGLISYPIYLWHWPLLAFGNVLTESKPAPWFRFAMIPVVVALAFATYRLVEAPLRFGTNPARKTALLSLAMIAIAVWGFSVHRELFRPRSSAYDLDRLESAKADFQFPGTRLVPQTFDGLQTYALQGGPDGEVRQRILMFGDSNMQQYLPRLERLADEDRLAATSVVFATLGGCPPVPRVRHAKKPLCDGFVDAVLRYVRGNKVDKIVIAALWFQYFQSSNYYFDSQRGAPVKLAQDVDGQAYQALATMIRELRQSGAQIWLVLNIPIGTDLDPRSMLNRPWGHGPFATSSGGLRETDLLTRYGAVRERLLAIADETGAQVVDPLVHLCRDGWCAAVDHAQEPIYKDTVHLRASFVRDRVRYLDPVLSPSTAAERQATSIR